MEKENQMKTQKKNSTKRKSRGNYLTKGIVAFIALGIVAFIFAISPNYKNDEIKDKINVIINNKNITGSLKEEIYIDEKGNIYMSKQDLQNFFDPDIYYNDPYNQIITTYNKKIAVLGINETEMKMNDSIKKISAPAIKKEDTFYLPISEMTEVYNIDLQYIKNTGIILIDSLEREQIKADSSKNISVKWKTKVFSRTVDKLKRGDKLVVISTTSDGWAKVRTLNGKIGYVKEKNIANKMTVREQMSEPEKLKKVSLVWDYYSEYVTCPDRSGETINGINVISPAFFVLKKLGKGDMIDKVGEEGKAYIQWAKSKGYEVWGMVANDSMIETTSEIMRDYKLREKTINNIVNLALKYELDGINIDFENMYKEDKDLFSRFIIELYPRLKEYGIILSVDVTAPDGGDTWSLCFDRTEIAKNSDYIIFMAYDQHGVSSTEAGTVAGYDWARLNLTSKFLGYLEIPKEKIILGIPFYTRLWTETEGQDLSSSIVNMKDVNSVIAARFPSSVQKAWDDKTKQNYIEYKTGNTTRKMWIEDKDSIKAKLDMAEELELAGVAFWAKDREDSSIWNSIGEYLNK